MNIFHAYYVLTILFAIMIDSVLSKGTCFGICRSKIKEDNVYSDVEHAHRCFGVDIRSLV